MIHRNTLTYCSNLNLTNTLGASWGPGGWVDSNLRKCDLQETRMHLVLDSWMDNWPQEAKEMQKLLGCRLWGRAFFGVLWGPKLWLVRLAKCTDVTTAEKGQRMYNIYICIYMYISTYIFLHYCQFGFCSSLLSISKRGRTHFWLHLHQSFQKTGRWTASKHVWKITWRLVE